MSTLHADLSDALELLSKATPGQFVARGRWIGTANHMTAIAECRDNTGCWTDDESATTKAAAIVAAVNLLRRHGPEIARRLGGEGDGWTEWHGGEKCPVSPDLPVEVELRDGERGVREGGAWFWPHVDDEPGLDIVRYRVLPAAPSEAAP